MKITRFDINDIPMLGKNEALCLGFFDGVHLGHREVIRRALDEGYDVSVMTFDRSPLEILKGKENVFYLSDVDDKSEWLDALGVKNLYILRFDEKTAAMDKDEFIRHVLRFMNPAKIFSGADYSFGRHGAGKKEDLEKAFPYEAVPLLTFGERKVSTHGILPLIEEGNVEEAASLLGRPYRLTGIVREGLHNGRTIGFPTLNIALSFAYELPRNGVYAGYTEVDGKKYKSIINVGYHPTFGDLPEEQVESHLLGYSGKAYGKSVRAEFVFRLRDERKFASPEELRAQLENDAAEAEKRLQ